LRLSIGNPSGNETVFRLEIASDRKSLLTAIAIAARRWLVSSIRHPARAYRFSPAPLVRL
jgi:hypothetical protein